MLSPECSEILVKVMKIMMKCAKYNYCIQTIVYYLLALTVGQHSAAI